MVQKSWPCKVKFRGFFCHRVMQTQSDRQADRTKTRCPRIPFWGHKNDKQDYIAYSNSLSVINKSNLLPSRDYVIGQQHKVKAFGMNGKTKEYASGLLSRLLRPKQTLILFPASLTKKLG